MPKPATLLSVRFTWTPTATMLGAARRLSASKTKKGDLGRPRLIWLNYRSGLNAVKIDVTR